MNTPTIKIKEYLNQLPDGYRELALANHEKLGPRSNGTPESIRDAIDFGFAWEDTPEGRIFWSDVYYCKLPPLPNKIKRTFVKINSEDLERLDGQYVLLWEFDNALWSDTIKVEDGKIFSWDSEEGWRGTTKYSGPELSIYPAPEFINHLPQEKINALKILGANRVWQNKGAYFSVGGNTFRANYLDDYDFEEIEL